MEYTKEQISELQTWLSIYTGIAYNEKTILAQVQLHLGNHKLPFLPEIIDIMKGLQHLHFEYNRLKSLPESIGELSELKELFLQANKLTSLPTSITRLKKLNLLYIDENPNLILTQSQADFISSIKYHSDLSRFTIIPDSDLAKDLFL